MLLVFSHLQIPQLQIKSLLKAWIGDGGGGGREKIFGLEKCWNLSKYIVERLKMREKPLTSNYYIFQHLLKFFRMVLKVDIKRTKRIDLWLCSTNRIYDGVEAETRKSQASLQIFSQGLPSIRFK